MSGSMLTLSDLAATSGLSGRRKVELERGLEGGAAQKDAEKKKTKRLMREGEGAIAAPVSSVVEKRAARQAGYEAARETMQDWDPAVQAEKRNEALRFGQRRKIDASSADLVSKFEPRSALEKEIDSLLKNNSADSDRAVNKRERTELASVVGPKEMEERFRELAKTRNLLFYAEQKAKYHARVKSKAYAAVRRKRNKKRLEAAKTAAAEADPELAQQMEEDTARSRVKERADLKHSSKSAWAKANLKRPAGRKADNTRKAMRETLELGQELKKKQLLEDEEEEEDDDIDGLRNSMKSEEALPDTGLFNMKFMRKAVDKQRERARDEAAVLLKELEEEERAAEEEEDEEDTLRALNGIAKISGVVNEGDEDESPASLTEVALAPGTLKLATRKQEQPSTVGQPGAAFQQPEKEQEEAPPPGAWLAAVQRAQKRGRKLMDRQQQTPAQMEEKQEVAEEAGEDEEKPSEKEPGLLLSGLSQRELVDVAFAGDEEEEAAFAAHKREVEEEEVDTKKNKKQKMEEEVVPGWGSWTGEGVVPSLKKRRRDEEAPLKKKKENVPNNISELPNVIINPKRVKKASELKIAQVPYPFTSREQYERYMRKPVGPEWNSTGAVAKLTMPAATVRAGVPIDVIKRGKTATAKK